MNPYAVGDEYVRSELLAYVGSGQRQSGVVWGPREPGCLICTSGGRHGLKAGYEDSEFPGGWRYFGQGTSGDQTLANAANAKLASGEYSVLLFTSREPTAAERREAGNFGKRFCYQGEFNVLDYEPVRVDRGVRKGDLLFQFNLIRSRSLEQQLIDSSNGVIAPDGAAEAEGPARLQHRITSYRVRSAATRRHALNRAKGLCEGCGMNAPFLSEDGIPYLEVHHILRLADDGPDAPANVAALCPNCHRRAHYAEDRGAYRFDLQDRILRIESSGNGGSTQDASEACGGAAKLPG